MKGKDKMNEKDLTLKGCMAGRIIALLPPSARREISTLAVSRRGFYTALSEIRIRIGKQSVLTVGTETVKLRASVDTEGFMRIFNALTEDALYAHRGTLREGYVPLAEGVRMGVCGDFSEGGELSRPTSLVFRFPTAECESAEQLYAAWEKSRSGMLIYSPVGVGKTSALRSLADLISRRTELNVVAVDERYEFLPERCPAADVLRGHTKAKGLEIAKRVLGADVILVDEIGNSEEARAVLSVGRGGASVIATAHAESESELGASESIRLLLDSGYFKLLAGLSITGERRTVKITKFEKEPLTV